MDPQELQILANCRLFQGIGPVDLSAMLTCLQPQRRDYPKGALIAQAGTKFDGIGIVLEGAVAVLKQTAAGNRVLLTVAGPGEIYGEMAAWSTPALWPATVEAQRDSIIWLLAPQRILGSCATACPWHQRLLQNLLGILSQRALGLSRRIDYLTLKGMRPKLATFLLEEYEKKRQASFVLPFKRNELADFLSVSRPSMSRELGRMRDEGLIEFQRQAVKIRDWEALRRAADLNGAA